MKELVNKIKELKERKNAVILAHCYQNVEIDDVADYVGDSLYLSQMAAKTGAKQLYLRVYILWHRLQKFYVRIKKFFFRI